MVYSNSVAFSGDPERLLSVASTILMTNGFAVVEQDAARILFAGPGLNSTKQNPLLGASSVHVRASDGLLTIEAEYGGVESLRRFMIRFPLLLGLGIGLAFAVIMLAAIIGMHLSGIDFGAATTVVWWSPLLVMLPALLAVSPWVFLAPWIRQHLERKTTAAIDTLMVNVCHTFRMV